jgi:hypothetical protein
MGNGEKNSDLEKSISQKLGDILSDVRNVFQSIWVRLSIQDDIRLDKFLLDYGRNFLLRCGTLFLIIYLLQKLF